MKPISIRPFVLVAAALVPGTAAANLCGLDHLDDRYRNEAALIDRQAFAPASPDYRGEAEYNAWVLACNRERDTNGKEIDKAIPPTTGGSFAQDLPALIIKGKLNYYGTVFTQLKYAYRLRRDAGTWILSLPISFHFPDKPLKNRIDITEELAIQLNLKSAPGSGPGTRECDKGQEKMSTEKKRGQLLVDTGFIDSDDGPACRLARTKTLADGTTLLERYHELWKVAIETAFSRDGFRVEVLFPDFKSPLLVPVSEQLQNAFRLDDVTWKIRFSDNPDKRATYKPVPFKWENAPMAMDGSTIAHESGHYLGLDDEYREKVKSNTQWRDCDSHGGDGYLMCSQGYAQDDSPEGDPGGIGYPESAKGIYAWILTRRYAIGSKRQCASDADCGDRRYCYAPSSPNPPSGPIGPTTTSVRLPSQCVERSASCESCSNVQKCALGLDCKNGRCIDPGARKSIGAGCCRDDQCASGSCNKNGQCQCKDDQDCGDSGLFCDAGGFLGTGVNTCVRKAGQCGSCNKDDQCAAGRCQGGRCITESSVALGGACCKDAQCTTGSCNSDGRCQCTKDEHCGTGRCETGGKNVCQRQVGTCEQCNEDDDCTSNNCKNGRCIVAASVAMGGTCCRDAQCTTGSCNEVGQCQCTKNEHCQGDKKCKEGFLGFGRNECK